MMNFLVDKETGSCNNKMIVRTPLGNARRPIIISKIIVLTLILSGLLVTAQAASIPALKSRELVYEN